MQTTRQPQVGPPTLLSIVQVTLKRFKSLLGDIGSVQVPLLWDALSACTANELSVIEDATLAGVAQRDLSPYTWPLWWRHCTTGFLSTITTMPKSLPALDSPSAVDPPQPGVKPADYRLVYEHLQQQVEERRTMTGKRLKDMRTEQEKKKASRCVQVTIAAVGALPFLP